MPRSKRPFPEVVLVTALAIGVLCFAIAGDGSDAALREGVRLTARTSLALFVLAFVASSSVALFRDEGSKWLLRNRKYIGNSFATSHAFHGALVLLLAQREPDFWSTVATSTALVGTLGYVFLAAMVVTSFEGPARALGRRRWKLLHKTGMYLFWFIFLATYAGMAVGGSAFGIAVTLILFAALGLRIAARRRK